MARSVIVVGAGQGGLAAAIYARLAGKDVLVLEKQDRSGGKAAGVLIDGYRLDPGPSIIILTRIYSQVFKDAGRSISDYLEFERLDPVSQVRFEGFPPVDLPANADECLRVLADVSPPDAKPLRGLMDKLHKIAPLIDRTIFAHPYHHAWRLLSPSLIRTALPFRPGKTYKELVDGWFQHPMLKAFFYGFPSYGGQSYDAKSFAGLLIPFLMLEEGVWYPRGGVAAIPAAFERLARELGVEFRHRSPVAGFECDGNRVRSVHLESGERVAADAVICNVDRFTAGAWLGHPCQLEPSYSYFTLQWGLRRKMPDLRHHCLLIPSAFEEGFESLYRRNEFPAKPIVYLNAPSVTDQAAAPPGCMNLFAVVTCPALRPSLDWSGRQGEYRERVLRTMLDLGVEIDANEVEFERVQTPMTFAERDGSYRGSLYGPGERRRLWGLFPAKLCDDKIRNLFYCGGSVQPGAGLPMVTLSGKFAAGLVG